MRGTTLASHRPRFEGWLNRRAAAPTPAFINNRPVAVVTQNDTSNWRVSMTLLDAPDCTVELDFASFVSHIEDWTNKRLVRSPAFSVLPGFPMMHAIEDILSSGASIYTARAVCRLIQ